MRKLKPVVMESDKLGHLYCDWKLHCPAEGKKDMSPLIADMVTKEHDAFASEVIGDLLRELLAARDLPESNQRLIVDRLWLSWERAVALPSEFVERREKIIADASITWEEAREQDNFNLFAPHLEKVIEVTREAAGYYGADLDNIDSIYSALLVRYEPGMKMSRLTEIMDSVEKWLVPFFARIREADTQPSNKVLYGFFPPDKQKLLSDAAVRTIGFNFKQGALVMTKTTHPFTAGIGPRDCRISTRYLEDYFPAAFFASLHEGGHGLFDQGVSEEVAAVRVNSLLYSLGMHETQSRLWENIVGRDRSFWNSFYPVLRAIFPEFWDVSLDEFYQAINVSKPGPIRIYADEVSYNLHILVRFELEKALLSGSLKVKDLPAEFNRLMIEKVGIEPKSMKEGVLQDTHWSGGDFGYFPTYLLGNLGGVQLFAEYAGTTWEGADFEDLLVWLRAGVYSFGMVKTLDGLLKEVTEEPLNPGFWFDYIEQKFGEIYKL